MRKIYDGIVYDVVPKTNGIVFFCRENEDEPVTVKMLSFEDGRLIDVGLTVYAVTKLGNHYHKIVKHCDNYVLDHIIPLPSGRMFLCTQKGDAFLFDSVGEVSWTGEIKYRDQAPSGIAFYKNSLWASFAEANILLRFNLNTMRPDLRIGGKNSPFVSPSDVFCDDETAVVCSSKNNALIKANLESYAVEPYFEFNEGPKKYLKVESYEFVVLDSGLYLIN